MGTRISRSSCIHKFTLQELDWRHILGASTEWEKLALRSPVFYFSSQRAKKQELLKPKNCIITTQSTPRRHYIKGFPLSNEILKSAEQFFWSLIDQQNPFGASPSTGEPQDMVSQGMQGYSKTSENSRISLQPRRQELSIFIPYDGLMGLHARDAGRGNISSPTEAFASAQTVHTRSR